VGEPVEDDERAQPEARRSLEARAFEGPISRMRNAGQSAAASHFARVFKHQTHTALDGEHVKSGNLRGAGVSSPV